VSDSAMDVPSIGETRRSSTKDDHINYSGADRREPCAAGIRHQTRRRRCQHGDIILDRREEEAQ
jgi:hypothetical protein